jgi:hypothetical protein
MRYCCRGRLWSLNSSFYGYFICFYLFLSVSGKGKLKFVRNGVEPSVPLCEEYLRHQLDVLNSTSASAVSITLIGIGR